MKSKKVFVFALDGLPLNLALKLAKSGLMPNLKRLFEKAQWGVLESTMPPMTATAWVAFATGKNPGETGIFNFFQPEDNLNNLNVISSGDIRGKTFYERLEKKGKKVIFVNLPCSYPSRIKKGVLISSFLAGDDFFYPQDLIDQVPELAKYKVTPDFVISLNMEKGIKDTIGIEECRFSVGKKLFAKEWDLFFYLVSGTDWAMHLAFDQLIGDKKIDSNVKKVFKEADSYLGRFLGHLPQNTTVLIMSDHGFTSTSKVFYINAWLKKNKLLDLKLSFSREWAESLTEVLKTQMKPKRLWWKGLRKMIIFLINNRLFYPLLVSLVKVASRFFPEVIPAAFLDMCLRINSKKTKAYALPGSGGQYGLFINDKKRFKQGIVSEKDYPKLRQRLYRQLVDILGKDDVWLREEVCQGKALEKFPDILYRPKEIFVSPAFSKRIFAKRRVNHHSQFGLFLILNKRIKKGKKVKGLKIVDLAPMILSFMGIKNG